MRIIGVIHAHHWSKSCASLGRIMRIIETGHAHHLKKGCKMLTIINLIINNQNLKTYDFSNQEKGCKPSD